MPFFQLRAALGQHGELLKRIEMVARAHTHISQTKYEQCLTTHWQLAGVALRLLSCVTGEMS